jgi:hypothetical protein
LVPTSDAALVKMIRNLLLSNEHKDISIPLTSIKIKEVGVQRENGGISSDLEDLIEPCAVDATKGNEEVVIETSTINEGKCVAPLTVNGSYSSESSSSDDDNITHSELSVNEKENTTVCASSEDTRKDGVLSTNPANIDPGKPRKRPRDESDLASSSSSSSSSSTSGSSSTDSSISDDDEQGGDQSTSQSNSGMKSLLG